MKNNVKLAKELVRIAKLLLADNKSELNRLYNDFNGGYQENVYDNNIPKEYSFKNYTGEIRLDNFFMEVKNATFDICYNQIYGLHIEWQDGVWINGTTQHLDIYWKHGYDKFGNEHGEFDSPDNWK